MPLPFAASTAIKIGTAIFGFGRRKKARKNRAIAAKAQSDIARIANRQARRQFIQNFRQAQASAVVSGVASGASLESSAVQGTLGSNTSQAQSAVRDNDRQQTLSKVAGDNLAKASRREFQAGVFDTIGALASSDGFSDDIDKLGAKIGFKG